MSCPSLPCTIRVGVEVVSRGDPGPLPAFAEVTVLLRRQVRLQGRKEEREREGGREGERDGEGEKGEGERD